MSPKRGDRAAPPVIDGEYDVRFANTRAAQWQYEVTGGGRIWYLIDDPRRTVWITYAGTGHPKPTD